MNTSIVTYTGKVFDYTNPTTEMICIEDIAHSLSLTCRFQGHTRKFYSVAEHCVRMSYICDYSDALISLLHDAAEAYIGDIPRPQKKELGWRYVISQSSQAHGLINYRDVENSILSVVGEVLGISDICNKVNKVKENDIRMYVTEIQKLMPKSPEFGKWTEEYTIVDVKWPERMQRWGWNCYKAEVEFLRRYNSLKLQEENNNE